MRTATQTATAIQSATETAVQPTDTSIGTSAPPAAFLDHVVVMLDGETYNATIDSPFVRESLGRFKIKQATSTLASTYTSAGVAGGSTLVELFDIAAPPLPGLAGAIVLSFPQPGSMARARQRLEQEVAAEMRYELVRRTVNEGEEPSPWYHLLRPDFGQDSPFMLMLAEVTPAYFAHLGAAPGPDGEMPRQAYLDAAMGVEHDPAQYLQDVTAVTVNLRPQRAAVLRATLAALGYGTSNGGHSYRGPEIIIHITTVADWPEGITELRAALTHPYEAAPATLRFGPGSVFAFEADGTARWRFTPQPSVPPT